MFIFARFFRFVEGEIAFSWVQQALRPVAA